MINKSALRKEILDRRKTLEVKTLSVELCRKLSSNKQYQNAKNIFAYYPKKYEVDITSLFNDKDKNWFLPKIINDKLEFIEYKIGDNLIKNSFGVFEPIKNPTTILPDLIIVPALTTDKKGYRLGYGKGYYDMFLSETPYNNIFTVSLVFDELLVNDIMPESHDKKINLIIS